jgi:hypothetical protein
MNFIDMNYPLYHHPYHYDPTIISVHTMLNPQQPYQQPTSITHIKAHSPSPTEQYWTSHTPTTLSHHHQYLYNTPRFQLNPPPFNNSHTIPTQNYDSHQYIKQQHPPTYNTNFKSTPINPFSQHSTLITEPTFNTIHVPPSLEVKEPIHTATSPIGFEFQSPAIKGEKEIEISLKSIAGEGTSSITDPSITTAIDDFTVTEIDRKSTTPEAAKNEQGSEPHHDPLSTPKLQPLFDFPVCNLVSFNDFRSETLEFTPVVAPTNDSYASTILSPPHWPSIATNTPKSFVSNSIKASERPLKRKTLVVCRFTRLSKLHHICFDPGGSLEVDVYPAVRRHFQINNLRSFTSFRDCDIIFVFDPGGTLTNAIVVISWSSVTRTPTFFNSV